MKKKILPIFVLAASTVFSHADYYRTDNADSDWSNLDNWSTSASEYVRPAEAPGTGGATNIWFLKDGTKTVFTGSAGDLTFSSFRIQAADITFSGANVTVNGAMINGDQAPGSADNYAVTNLVIDNGSNVSVNTFFGGFQEYTELNMTITGNSTFTQRSTNWSDFSLIGNSSANVVSNRKATLTIDKGSQMLLGANLNVNSTHSKAPDSEAIINVKGILSAKGFVLAQGKNAKAVMNIYGSADIETAGNTSLNTSGAVMNFIMQDVSASRVSHVSGGVIENPATAAIFRSATINDRNGKIYINLEDFSVEGDYILGETYAIALISSGETSADLIKSLISLENEDLMGTSWELSGTGTDEYLTISDNTIFLNVTHIPEPGTCAAIFGVLSLALASYRRMK